MKNQASSVMDLISSKISGPSSKEQGTLVAINGSSGLDLDRIRTYEDLSLALSFSGENLFDESLIRSKLRPVNIYFEEDIFILDKILDTNAKLILANLTLNTLSKVTSGLIDSLIPNLIYGFLYIGKPVYGDFSQIDNFLGKKTNNPYIKKLIEKNISLAREMGIKDLKDLEVRGSSQGEDSLGILKKTREEDKIILTEKDIKDNFKQGDKLRIKKTDIITPLARDLIRELKIDIEIL